MPVLTVSRVAPNGVQDAYEAVVEAVKNAPARADLRLALFQWLCVRGQWQRALAQLATAATLDAEASSTAYAYRAVLQCELHRKRVFAGQNTPLLAGQPAQWLANLLNALRLNASGHGAPAAALRRAAFDAAPACRVSVDGASYAWIADADMRLGPVLEAYIDGKYYWVPFSALQQVELEAPQMLRDLVWMPAWLTLATGTRHAAFIPTRYPGTEGVDDDAMLLARCTAWQDWGNDTWIGIGQRMFAAEADELPLLDMRTLVVQQCEPVPVPCV